MNIERENIDELNALVKIKLGPEDYENRVQTKLQDLRKKAKIPGFRQGHVPMGMIKKMAGASTMVEEINQILSKSIQDYISENQIKILGNPIPKSDDGDDIDWNQQKEFEFEFELGIAPNIDLNILNKIKLDKFNIQIDDKLLDEQMNDLAKRYGKMSEGKVAVEDDMLTGKFEEVDKNGNLIEDGIVNTTNLLVSTVENKKVKKALIGCIAGSSVVFKYDQFGSDEEKARLLGKEKADLIFNKSLFKFTIEKVNHIEPTEINQELFDKIFGPETVKSLDEFKQRVSQDLSKQFEQTSDQKLMYDIQEKIIEKSKLDLPNEFLKKWLLKANENPLTIEQIESEYDAYARSLKWQLLENNIIKEFNLEVSREDAEQYTMDLLRQQFAMYQQAEPEEAQLRDTAKNLLANNEEGKRIFDQLYDKKVIEYFKSNLRIKEKKISYNDFLKLAKK